MIVEPMIRRILSITAAALLAASCSSPSSNSGGETTTARNDAVQIVASTQVWADIAEKVVPDAQITPIASGQDFDPHSFEPTAADLAKAQDADILIVGGGGYDAWLYNNADQSKIVHALPLTEGHEHGHNHEHSHEHGDDHGDGHDHGHSHDHGHGTNEHIWFDLHAVTELANDLSKKVKETSPDTETTPEKVEESLEKTHNILHELPAKKVAQTHPIADLVVEHSKLEDVTPAGYHHSALNESEPAAADVAAFLDLIKAQGCEVLIDAPQTATDTTRRIREAAEQEGIKVVDVYELPKEGENYFDFMYDFTQRLSDATK